MTVWIAETIDWPGEGYIDFVAVSLEAAMQICKAKPGHWTLKDEIRCPGTTYENRMVSIVNSEGGEGYYLTEYSVQDVKPPSETRQSRSRTPE